MAKALTGGDFRLERPKGFQRTFHCDGKIVPVTYPVDYGSIVGLINPEDCDEVDVFRGGGGPCFGRFHKGRITQGLWYPDEHKWYYNCSQTDLERILGSWWGDKRIIRDLHALDRSPALLSVFNTNYQLMHVREDAVRFVGAKWLTA